MNMMKAAIYTGIEQIGIQEVERKSPEPGYVMLDTKCTGICGSDLHSYFGHWGQSDSLAAGHETCGVVVADLGKVLRHSNRAIRSPLSVSHTVGIVSHCEKGYYNHCLERKWVSQNTHGGFSEYTTAHASGLFKLPENMSYLRKGRWWNRLQCPTVQ